MNRMDALLLHEPGCDILCEAQLREPMREHNLASRLSEGAKRPMEQFYIVIVMNDKGSIRFTKKETQDLIPVLLLISVEVDLFLSSKLTTSHVEITRKSRQIPDNVNENSTSFVLFVAAVCRRPFTSHDSRLTAVLTVPDHVQRMVECFNADYSPFCNNSSSIVNNSQHILLDQR